MRGLPAWLLECFRTGLAKRAAADRKRSSDDASIAQDSRLRHDSITCEDLTEMGIVHPLHQRRLLREIGIMFGKFQIDAETHKNSPAKKQTPALPKKVQVPETKNLVPVAETEKELNHARRRYLLAEGLNKVPTAALPQDARELLSKRGSLRQTPVKTHARKSFIPDLIDLPRVKAASEPLEEDERMCDIDFEATEPRWDEWLQGRLHSCFAASRMNENELHSWGPLALISTLLSVAKHGDLTKLRQMTETVESHGKALLESLSCTPLPPDRLMPDAPPGTDQPKDVWSWVLWRQEILEDAQWELTEILHKADEVIASTSNNSKTKNAKIDKRKSMRLLPTGISRQRTGTTIKCSAKSSESPTRASGGGPSPSSLRMQSGEADELRKSRILDRGSIRFADTTSENATGNQDASPMSEEVARTPRPDLLAKFRKAAFSVLAHVKSSHGRDVLLNTNFLACISLQDRVRSVSQEIQVTQKRLGRWPGLMSEAHELCRGKLASLKQGSEQLFHRFVEIRKPLEEKLRMLTAGDQGVVDIAELEAKILSAQKELAARLLIGNAGWNMAHEAGVGIAQFGFDEAPDPWGGELHPSPPPWEATFIKAVKRFEPLRRGRETRRKAQTNVNILAKMTTLKIHALNQPGFGLDREDSFEEGSSAA